MTKFLVFNTKFIVINAQFLVFNAKFITFTHVLDCNRPQVLDYQPAHPTLHIIHDSIPLSNRCLLRFQGRFFLQGDFFLARFLRALQNSSSIIQNSLFLTHNSLCLINKFFIFYALSSPRSSCPPLCGNHHLSKEESSFSMPPSESLKNLQFLLQNLHFDLKMHPIWTWPAP